jgi:uncharacterized protein (TIGR03118 family)
MQRRLSSFRRLHRPLLAGLVTVGVLAPMGAASPTTAAAADTAGSVLQTNLVSDLPGAAAVADPNLVNAWGISESSGSPFWISDNNAGVTTLYDVPGAGTSPVSTVPLVVNIPTPVSLTGGAPTGTVFNTAAGGGAFTITGPNKSATTTSAPATFLFDTEDGTIIGWNAGIDPSGNFAGAGGSSAQAVVALDHSGNNFTNPDPSLQTGAVYKGLAIATSATPISATDPNSTAVLYASNFRDGTVEAYDATFKPVTGLAAGAFTDPALPAGYAPFDVQVLGGRSTSPMPARTPPGTTTWPVRTAALWMCSTSTAPRACPETRCDWCRGGRSTHRGHWPSPQRASPG